MPWVSAVTQMGSPPYHEPSSTVVRSVREYDSPRAGSWKLLLTRRCASGYIPVAIE